MSIITGKSLVAALAALTVAAGVQAEEKVLYSENFEEAIPGQTPKKWTKVWGSPGSDTFSVTNEKSAEGDNALLLTRGDNQGQWGFGVAFPHVDKGVVEISFDLLLEGPGNQACLGFEIRNNTSGRLIFGSATVQDFKIRDSKRKQVFSLTGNTWYKLKFTIPASRADGEQSKFEITDIKTGQSATMESAIKEYPNKLGLLCINTLPGKNNFKAFIDDVKVTVK